MIAINLKVLKAVALCASTEQTRYYLNGVCLQPDLTPGHIIMVATDGHKMLVARQEIGDGDQLAADIIIPSEIIAKIKLSKRGDNIASLAIGEEAAAHCRLDFADGTSAGFKAIDGSFPEWRRVVPKEVDGKTAQFNTAYLDTFRKAGELAEAGVPYFLHNGCGPAVVRFSFDRVFGIVMPLGTSRDENKPAELLPEWLNPTPPPAYPDERGQLVSLDSRVKHGSPWDHAFILHPRRPVLVDRETAYGVTARISPPVLVF
jgi:hypothetical protein